ncbi:MAG: hypothetical protein RLZZ399_68 [Verrucomicrobiota bacterium]|jgi:sec-independent protein translocase protein TatA
MNSLALLPNLAGPDMLIIFMIVLILFGAKKLPELAKGLGQAVKEFSKAKEDVNQEFHRAAQVPHSSHGSNPHDYYSGDHGSGHGAMEHGNHSVPPSPAQTQTTHSPTAGSSAQGSSEKPHA